MILADYEIYLMYNNQSEGFQLPLNPETIEVKGDGGGKTYDIIGRGGGTEETRAGEVNVIKNPKLREVKFTSIFPAQYYPFLSLTEEASLFIPMHYVNQIRKWQESKHPIRFIFAGNYAEFARANDIKNTTDLNFPASIESFEWKESAGSPGDIEYSIHLKEYVFYSARKVIEQKDASGNTVLIVQPPDRPDERIRPETWTLRRKTQAPSDNLLGALMKAAMRFYNQDSGKWSDLMKYNNISSADLKRTDFDGMVIKLPPK